MSNENDSRNLPYHRNVSYFLRDRAMEVPSKLAVVGQKKGILKALLSWSRRHESYTFLELEKRSNLYAQTLLSLGINRGVKTLVFFKPGPDFACFIYAIFKIGAVAIFIDPGMGVEALLKCIAQSGATALIGIPKIHHLKLLKPQSFQDITISIVVDGMAIGAHSLEKASKGLSTDISIVELDENETCALLFTSGGTGTPKAVTYTHKMFSQQVFSLKKMFRLTVKDRDYACFPLFSLFSLAMGLTTYIPDVDLIKPADINPKALVKNLLSYEITFSTGSPALWLKVANYCQRKKISLPHLKSIVMFGAPVSIELHQIFQKILVSGDTYTAYGATECLPVACISGREILQETAILTAKGSGTCLGYLAPEVLVKIKKADGDEKRTWKEEFEIGEILVDSPTATVGYAGNPEATKLSKEGLFHCMGDMGRIDQWGRLWFLGRKTHTVNLIDQVVGAIHIYTEEIEPLANAHSDVLRSALVKVKNNATLVIERKDGRYDMPSQDREKFLKEIKELIGRSPKGRFVQDILLHSDFPVDTRHNIKIDRLKLAELLGIKEVNLFKA